jgi:hypothetical protein
MSVKDSAKDILAKIKAVFDGAPAPAPQTPAPTTTAPAPVSAPSPMIVSYPVDGGQPVYVDCSDDGIADIDVNDPVYVDALLSSPYPDGTYNVTGTDFGFTVSAGLVSAVTDADGTGPGAPIEMAATPAPVTPAYTTPPTPSPAPVVPVTQSQMEEATGKLQVELDAVKTELQAAKAKSERNDEVIKGLFELVGKLTELPAAEPKTLTGNTKDKFERNNKKEERLNKIAEAMKEIRKNK